MMIKSFVVEAPDLEPGDVFLDKIVSMISEFVPREYYQDHVIRKAVVTFSDGTQIEIAQRSQLFIFREI